MAMANSGGRHGKALQQSYSDRCSPEFADYPRGNGTSYPDVDAITPLMGNLSSLKRTEARHS
jgi:hypothetical protein